MRERSKSRNDSARALTPVATKESPHDHRYEETKVETETNSQKFQSLPTEIMADSRGQSYPSQK